MPHPLTNPRQSRDDARAIVRRLRDHGHVAYFAGGCVRDELLGIAPKDYDVATDAPPDRVRSIFANTQAVGAAFGVVLVRHGQSVVEVATFRSDGEYHDGRRPSVVAFTDAAHDAQRRDFTINGMFLDPLTGEVIDHVGGRADLDAKLVRAIGDPDRRFAEDHLRLLRAIRFAARFGFTIEPVTAASVLANAPHLKRISPERIAEELRLMLTPGVTRAAAWRYLWELRLLDEVMRFLPERGPRHLDPARSIFLNFDPMAPKGFGLALAVAVLCYRWQHVGGDVRALLGHAEAQRAAKAMRQALRISNEEADEMTAVLTTIAPLVDDRPPTLAMKKRFLSRRYYPGTLNLLEALTAVGFRAEFIWSLWAELMTLQTTDVAPPPLITGDDLAAAGMTPGPVFKRVLDAVYDAQLEGRVTTRDQAMELAMSAARG